MSQDQVSAAELSRKLPRVRYSLLSLTSPRKSPPPAAPFYDEQTNFLPTKIYLVDDVDVDEIVSGDLLDEDATLGDVAALDLSPGTYVDALVTQPYGPNSFYAQPFFYEAKIKSVSLKMNSFYKLLEQDELPLNSAFLTRPGGLCAAKWQSDGWWYRAKYLERVSPSAIKVLFIDFGNCDMISIIDCRHLISKFRRIRPMALHLCDSHSGQLDPKRFVELVDDNVVVLQMVFTLRQHCSASDERMPDGRYSAEIFKNQPDGTHTSLSQLLRAEAQSLNPTE